MKIRICKEHKQFRLLIFLIIGLSLILGLSFNEKKEVYPNWQEPFHISLDMYDGDTHCLKSDYSHVYVDIINKVVTIHFNVYKDYYCKEFEEGKIIFTITNITEPKIEGLDGLYYLNKTEYDDSYAIILDTKNMGKDQYKVVINGIIPDKFYRNYFIQNNNGPMIPFVKFSYDNEKYDCDGCFFLYEGDLIDNGNIPIWRDGNIESKEYYLENETFVLFSFYPKLRGKIWWQNILRSLIISLIAGMCWFLLEQFIWKKIPQKIHLKHPQFSLK